MARKWPLKPVYNWNGKASRNERELNLGIFGRTLIEVQYRGYLGVDYGIYDTLLVSYSRYLEFKRLMLQKPIDERSKILPSIAVGHNLVFYTDNQGHVTKYLIEGD